MGQTSYGFATPKGVAGGLFDISNYGASTRINAADDGDLKFGMGVVFGESAQEIVLPETGDTAAEFRGLVLNDFSTEQDMKGVVSLKKGKSVSCMEYGRAWARVPAALTGVKDGDALYLIITGDNAGLFTNAATDNVAIKGKFIGEIDGGLAPIELFHEAQA